MAKRINQKKVLAEINLWIERLGISNWHVEVEFVDKVPRDKAKAMITMSPADEGYRNAHLRIYVPAWLKDSERNRTLTVVHELLHLRFAKMWLTLEKYVGDATIVGKAFDAEVETLCDELALNYYRTFRRKSAPLTNGSK